MPKQYEKYERGSNFFLLVGSVLSKCKYIPIPFIRAFSNVASLLMYYIGYVLWFNACQHYPYQTGERDPWYSFNEFKRLYAVSALIGAVGVAVSLLALINPLAFIPSAWLMVASNIFWSAGEYEKLGNPPEYRQLPHFDVLKNNFSYSTISLSISLITALSVTAGLLFPVASIYIASVATIITVGLTLWAFEHILENWWSGNKEVPSQTGVVHTPDISPSMHRLGHGEEIDKRKINIVTNTAKQETPSLIQPNQINTENDALTLSRCGM